MKLLLLASVLALAPSVAGQSCMSKTGQLNAINELISQWAEIQTKVEQNNLIVSEQRNTKKDRRSNEGKANGVYKEKKEKALQKRDEQLAAVQARKAARDQEIDTALNQALSEIDTEEAAKIQEVDSSFGEAEARAAARIDRIIQRQDRTRTNKALRIASADSLKSQKFTEADNKKNAAVASLSDKKGRKIAKLGVSFQNKKAVKRAAADVKILELQAASAAKIAEFQTEFIDAEATLAVLDNAVANGLYRDDCLLDVNTVVEYVKQEVEAREIWALMIGA